MSLSGAASTSRNRPGRPSRAAYLVLLWAAICGPAAGVVTGLAGCAHPRSAATRAAANSLASDSPAWIETQLYFGLGPSDHPEQGIGETRWRQFLDAEVTPRFPSGLTVVDAYGQWQGAGEAGVERLRSKVIILLHPDTSSENDKIDAVRTAWKKLTRDESVLRVDRAAAVRF